jgi:hypothetical protein
VETAKKNRNSVERSLRWLDVTLAALQERRKQVWAVIDPQSGDTI